MFKLYFVNTLINKCLTNLKCIQRVEDDFKLSLIVCIAVGYFVDLRMLLSKPYKKDYEV